MGEFFSVIVCYTFSAMRSGATLLVEYFFVDLLGSFFRFPAWWYTEGLPSVIASFWRVLRYRWRSYALGLWIRSFFAPMYGIRDWPGRLISIVIRTIVICVRGCVFLLEGIMYAVLTVVWVIFPIGTGMMFVYTILSTL